MTKVCAIHQPNFLPWLGYFDKMKKSDVFVFLDNVDIVTGTSKAITNRTRIKTSDGVQWLTIPIEKNKSRMIRDIKMVENSWRKKALTTLSISYRRAKNYHQIFPLIETLINFSSNNLSEFNMNAITQIADFLNIRKEFVIASQIPVKSNDRNQRIVEICRYLNCSHYISGSGGKKYHNEHIFSDGEIKILYSDFMHPVYDQMYGEFAEGLSIVDFLFNQSLEFA